jgi:hypothetical protein
MELLGDMGHVESRIGPFRDGVSVRLRYIVCTKQTIGSKIILETPDGVMRLKWKLISVRLVIVLILRKERCTVSVKHTIALKIVLDAPDGTHR